MFNLFASITLAFLALASSLQRAEGHSCRAVCVLPNGPVQGLIEFEQKSRSPIVDVNVTVSGLSSGAHGMHIHEFGDLRRGCDSTGGHYNPHEADHGSPDDQNRHVGDLGNIVADEEGKVSQQYQDSVIALHGQHSIVGRAVVIHSQEDDLGKTEHPASKTTGNAGSRVACCVIGLVNNVA